MKRNKKIVLAALSVLAMGLCLTACGEVAYNVIETDEVYEYEIRGVSGAVPEENVKIDGKLDDVPYSNLKKLTLKKDYQTQTANAEVTTFIGKDGLYFGLQVQESTTVYYNPTRNAEYNTSMSFYYGFGDDEARGSGIFEMIFAAGGQFSIRVMERGQWAKFGYAFEEAPLYAMQTEGDIDSGECHAWSAEAFVPYAVFGRTTRPSNVFFTIEHDVPESEIGMNRSRYNFALYQAGYSYATEMEPTTYPYVCNRNGFQYEEIEFDTKGNGSVTESYGYDRAILNKATTFVVKPAAGSVLKSFKINGTEHSGDLVNDRYTLVCQGKIQIETEFVEMAKLDSATLTLSGLKNGVAASVPDGTLTLIDADGNEKEFSVAGGTATVTNVYTINYEVIVGNTWYGNVFFDGKQTSYPLTLGYLFCDVESLTPGATSNLTNVGNNAVSVTGRWLDHNPSVVDLRMGDIEGDFTLTTTVKLDNFKDSHTERLSVAVSESGNVFNVFSRGMWMIGHGTKRDLDQDNGEEKGELADGVGAALLSSEGLKLTIARSGDTVTVKAMIGGELTVLDTFTVSGASQISFIIGAGSWTFSNVQIN